MDDIDAVLRRLKQTRITQQIPIFTLLIILGMIAVERIVIPVGVSIAMMLLLVMCSIVVWRDTSKAIRTVVHISEETGKSLRRIAEETE